MSQYFPQALVAQLMSITELTAIVGNSIYAEFVPQTHDMSSNGPALTYLIPTNPKGHVLTGSDGTSTAHVQLDAWCLDTPGVSGTAVVFQAIEAIRNGIDGPPNAPWGDGSCVIMSVVQQDDSQQGEQPKAGTDQPLRRLMSEYAIKYRVSIPTLS